VDSGNCQILHFALKAPRINN